MCRLRLSILLNTLLHLKHDNPLAGPIRHGRTLPFLRKPHKILKIVLWVTPNNSATSRAGFLIPKTSQMIRHRKSVLQGEGIFQTKEQIQTACSFQIQTKNTTERKFLIKTRFFTFWTMTGEKCTRAHVNWAFLSFC